MVNEGVTGTIEDDIEILTNKKTSNKQFKLPKMIQRMLLLSLLAVFALMGNFTQLNAQTDNPPPGKERGQMSREEQEERMKAELEKMATDLKLTEEQKTSFTSIMKKYGDKAMTLRQENKGDFQAMRKEMETIKAEQHEELKTVLTEEQMTQFEKIQEENRKRRGPRGRGPKPGNG